MARGLRSSQDNQPLQMAQELYLVCGGESQKNFTTWILSVHSSRDRRKRAYYGAAVATFGVIQNHISLSFFVFFLFFVSFKWMKNSIWGFMVRYK